MTPMNVIMSPPGARKGGGGESGSLALCSRFPEHVIEFDAWLVFEPDNTVTFVGFPLQSAELLRKRGIRAQVDLEAKCIERENAVYPISRYFGLELRPRDWKRGGEARGENRRTIERKDEMQNKNLSLHSIDTFFLRPATPRRSNFEYRDLHEETPTRV
jgi:hypothetical protein